MTTPDSSDISARLKQELAERTARAMAETAEAQARAAELATQDAERKAAVYDPTRAASEQAATSRQAVAEADLAAAKARREQLSELLPDLSKIDKSTLVSNDGGPAIMASSLTYRAIAEAAQSVAAEVSKGFPARPEETAPIATVLDTSDLDLATSDAVYLDVTTGFFELITTISALLEPNTDDPVKNLKRRSMLAAGDVVSVIAGAIPGVLSLLSAQRTLTTATVAADDTAAVAAVAGALTAHVAALVHDTFRTVPDGVVYGLLRALDTERDALSIALLAQADTIQQLTAEAVAKVDALAAATSAAAAKGAENDATLAAEVVRAKSDSDAAAAALAAETKRETALQSIATAADSFVTSIRTPAPGGRSLLATAALREELHAPATAVSALLGSPPAPGRFTHVLLVQAQASQTVQSTTNMPLWFKDRFSTMATASITYLLLKLPNTVVAGGTETCAASAHGKIGESYAIQN